MMPTSARTIVIGDLHGCYDELVALLDHVALGAEDRVVCVGDLIVLTESVGGYAAYRTRDLRVFELLLEVDAAIAISSIAFWEDSLMLGGDQGRLLRAAGVR